MKTKRRPQRVVYKYVEAPCSAPENDSAPQHPTESLAHRAWANCYQPPTVHFEVLSPITPASQSSKHSSQSSLTSSSHSSTNSASAHSRTTTSPPPLTPRSLPHPKAAPPPFKTRANSSPAVLTKPFINPAKPPTSQTTIPLSARPLTRPTESSFSTTTAAITTKDGTTVKERRVVSSQGYHDGNDAVVWISFKSPNWAYPLHKKVKGKKVLASYPHCQAW